MPSNIKVNANNGRSEVKFPHSKLRSIFLTYLSPSKELGASFVFSCFPPKLPFVASGVLRVSKQGIQAPRNNELACQLLIRPAK